MSETENTLDQAVRVAKEITSEVEEARGTVISLPAYNAMLTQIAASLLIGKTEGQVRQMWREIHMLPEKGVDWSKVPERVSPDEIPLFRKNAEEDV